MNNISNQENVLGKPNDKSSPTASENQKESTQRGSEPLGAAPLFGAELWKHDVFRVAQIDMTASEKDKIRQEFRQSNPPPTHLLILDSDDVPPEMLGRVEFYHHQEPPNGGSDQRLVRVWWDCPKCGAKPPTAHNLGGGPHFDGIRTCGNGCGTWETEEEWQAIRDANRGESEKAGCQQRLVPPGGLA